MLNYIWFVLIFIGILTSIINGNVQAVTDAAIQSAKNAVELCLGLIGVMSLWLGIMKIAEKAGLINKISFLLRPILVHLFPDIPPNHPAMGSIVMNISANILGSPFYGEYAILNSEYGDIIIIDRNGNYVSVPKGISVLNYDIVDNIAIIEKDDTYDVGYLNIKTGKTLFSPDTLSIFDNGYGVIEYGDGYIGVVDKNLDYVNKKIYVGDSYVSLSNGLINLTDYNEYYEPIASGYIDINGKTIIPKDYITLGKYTEGLIAAYIVEDNISKIGFLDINNNWVIKPQECSSYSAFTNGIAAFSKEFDEETYTEKFGIIDKTGKYILQPQFEDFSYDSNYAYAQINSLWGILDMSGLASNVEFNENDKPDSWAIEEVIKAIENKLVPSYLQSNYKQNITRKEFCDLAISLIESKLGKTIDQILSEKGLSISDMPFSDTTDKNVVAAYKLNIVNGKGNGIFAPNDSITRQEAAVMLTNAAKALGVDVNSIESSFADSKNIASWAKKSVDYVSSNTIMKGTNIGFEPSGKYTRQQAYLTIFRLFEAIK